MAAASLGTIAGRCREVLNRLFSVASGAPPARRSSPAQQPQALRQRQQPPESVVLAKQQPVLGARSEQPVRLVHPAGHQIVDQHADEGLVPPNTDRAPRSSARAAALSPATTPWPAASSYPVVPLTWPAKNRPGTARDSRVVLELRRREVVVLDRVAGSSHPHLARGRGPQRRNSSCTAGGSEVESPFTYISVVSSPSGSRNTWCRGASGNFTILSSIEGQYLGPRPLIAPPYSADSPRCRRDDLLQPTIGPRQVAGPLLGMLGPVVEGEPIRALDRRPGAPGARDPPNDRRFAAGFQS